MTFKLKFSFGSSDEKKMETQPYSGNDKVVFSCNAKNDDPHCTYSASKDDHDPDSAVQGYWEGDVFHIDWHI